jgi:hypothetical protein
VRCGCRVLAHVGTALRQAGCKGETKGVCERPADEAPDAPGMPPKGGGGLWGALS